MVLDRFQMSDLVKSGYEQYIESNPDVLKLLNFDQAKWESLEEYVRIHVNEFYEVLWNLEMQPKRILEWGSGFSTWLFSSFAQEWRSELIVTVDHNVEYQRNILDGLECAILQKHAVSLEGGIWPWDEPESNYASYPLDRYVEGFDCIFVDGRRRNECLLAARELLSPEGIVILHDGWRKRYRLGTRLFDEFARFDQYIMLRRWRKRSDCNEG